MAKRKSSKSIMEGWLSSSSATATSDQGFSSDASSSAGDTRKPASAAAAAAAGKKQRSEHSMAMAAAASSGALPPTFPSMFQQSLGAASAAAAITPEEQRLMRTRVVCSQRTHSNGGNGTSVPLSECTIKLSKLSGLEEEADVIDHVRRIKQRGREIPLTATCDTHLREQRLATARQNAAKSVALAAVKLAAQEAVQLEGGLEGHPPLKKPQVQAMCAELSAPGTLLHDLATNNIPFNINMGFLDRYGGCGPDGTRLVPKKFCREDEGYAFTTCRSPDGTQYRATATDPGRLSVRDPKKYFKNKVIYVSKRRCNAGEVEDHLIRLCLDEWRLPNLINKKRGGWAQTELDARWQSVSITYLDLTVAGAEKIVFHKDAHNALA